MGHKDTGPEYGPGHDGWYRVLRTDATSSDAQHIKAKTAFQAAQLVGTNLQQADVRPITCEACIDLLNARSKQVKQRSVWAHTCPSAYRVRAQKVKKDA